jgi:hypothetical protein
MARVSVTDRASMSTDRVRAASRSRTYLSDCLSHAGGSFAGLGARAGWTPFFQRACGLVGRARIGVPRKMVKVRSSEVKGSPGPLEKRGLHPASMRSTGAGLRGTARRDRLSESDKQDLEIRASSRRDSTVGRYAEVRVGIMSMRV